MIYFIGELKMKSIIPLFDTYSHNHTIRRTRISLQIESCTRMKWEFIHDLMSLFDLMNLMTHLRHPPK
jgi:hypothetical protein